MTTMNSLDDWKSALETLIDRHGLGHRRSEIRFLARPRISIRTSGVDPAAVSPTRSYMGGLPFGAPATRWPVTKEGRPLSHLMTVQLAELAMVGVFTGLPSTGALVFWLDVHPKAETGGYPAEAASGDHFRIDYLPDGPRVRLTPPGISPDLPPEQWASPKCWYFNPTGPPVYNPCSCSWNAGIELPFVEWVSEYVPRLAALYDIKEFNDLRYELLDIQGTPDHHMLGYAHGISSMSIERQAQVSGGGDERPANDSSADWRCLLQLDTDEEVPGWMWGDMGRAVFCIRERDLHAGRFDDCWAVVEG